MPKIFISYRRSDSEDVAGRIYDRLVAHFGDDAIFKDVDDIPFGADFRDYLNESLDQCQVVLAVIGNTWLNAGNGQGKRRLDNPADWVRLELEEALGRKTMLVVPLLVSRASLPRADDLPQSMANLAYRNSAQARPDPDFHKDMSRLIGQLEQYFARLSQPAAPPTPQPQPMQSIRVTPRSVTPPTPVQPRRAPASPQPLVDRSTPVRPQPISTARGPISRRRVVQFLGFSGGGIGAVLVGRALLQSFPDTSSTAPPLTAADFTPFDIEVVTVNETGEVVNREPKQAQAFREAIGATFLDLVAVPGGTFTMGSPDSELQRGSSEGPQRDVNVPAFLIGKYPVTQVQWKAVAALPQIGRDLNADPAGFKGDNLPVEQVSWDDAVEFCQRLSKQTGRAYRLPSEAEWEYACRAGTTTPFHFGETITTDLANYRGTDWDYQGKTYPGNYGQGPKGEFCQKTTEVGSFKIANAFGLYDMHGNVWEWCADHWHESYEGAPTDSSAWTTGGDDSLRVLRGGSWDDDPGRCRSAYRLWFARDNQSATVGFRLVCASSWAL